MLYRDSNVTIISRVSKTHMLCALSDRYIPFLAALLQLCKLHAHTWSSAHTACSIILFDVSSLNSSSRFSQSVAKSGVNYVFLVGGDIHL